MAGGDLTVDIAAAFALSAAEARSQIFALPTSAATTAAAAPEDDLLVKQSMFQKPRGQQRHVP